MIIVSNQIYRCFKFDEKKIIVGIKSGKQFLKCAKFFFKSDYKFYNVLAVTMRRFQRFV